MSYAARDVAEILNCAVPAHPNFLITHLGFDSRRIARPHETLFFAIVGKQHDGHHFVKNAYQRGVRNFVVQDLGAIHTEGDANYFTVPDSVLALQQLAAHHRNRFDIPVIAVTGSNGKTTVKEWLHQLLSPDHKIVRSPNSYNSQIGVPISVWEMDKTDELALFEAGISQKGEMERLEPIIRPTIGLITNLGPAHDEGFESRSEKLSEKLNLFRRANVVIYSRDQEEVHQGIQKQVEKAKKLTWGHHPASTLRIIRADKTDKGHTSLELLFNGNSFVFDLPFSDHVGIENVCHALAVCAYLEIPFDVISNRVQELQRVELRLEMKSGLKGGLLVYDCYNADLKSLEVALDFLDVQSHELPKAVVITDLLETGMLPDQLYQEITEKLVQHGISKVIGIGSEIARLEASLTDVDVQFFHIAKTEDFSESGLISELEGHAVLLKGARKFRVERLGKLLEQQAHGTVLEINLSNVVDNLRVYRELLNPGVRVMAMVKAFSYGSGTYEIANVLQYHQVDYLAVAYVDEGIHLRDRHIQLPIMVMNPEPGQMELFRKYDLEPEIYSLELLNAVIEEQGPLKIHLKVDTGMHRLGFDPEAAPQIGDLLEGSKQTEVVSAFTHLAASEDPTHDDFTRNQVQKYEHFYTELIEVLGYQPLRHVLNSSGISRFSEYQLDMVRLGIGMYGEDPAKEMQQRLRPVARLLTTVSQVRDVQAGESIGYGRTAALDTPRRIATVGIGYADGFRRVLSQGVGQMMIHGKIARVIGNVCMDMTMLDVTHIPEVKAGDKVEVFGSNLPISRIAMQANTISYEILAGISQRVKRVYVED